MASGGESKRPNDPKADDPSIIGISSSQHGSYGRQNNQRTHPSSHPGAARPKQDRQMHHQQQQQHQTRRQYQQQPTPTSNEKRHHEHWKVPQGNTNHSPLAKDLFGAEHNPSFNFNFQVQDHHYRGPNSQYDHHYGYRHQSGPRHPGHYGGRGNAIQNHPKHYQGQPRYEGHGSGQNSRANYRQHNGGTSQQEKGNKPPQKVTPKPQTPSQNPTESERKVQFIEKLMKNGETASNLKITVVDKPGEKRTVKEPKTPEKSSKMPAKSLLEDAVKKSPANKFSNPLMESTPAEMTPQPSGARRPTEKTPGQTNNEGAAAGPSATPETPAAPAAEKPEKKKKKRNREKKKKKDKIVEDVKPKHTEVTGQTSQASTASSDSKSNQKPSPDIQKTVDTEERASVDPKIKTSDRAELNGQSQVKKEEKPSVAEEQDVSAKKLEELGLEQAEKRLEKDMIFKLEKKSTTFPEAIYFCKLCKHHLNTVAHAHKHIKDKRHKRETKAKQQDELLRKLKPPPPGALAALDRHLEVVIKENMMSQDDAIERKNVVDRLNEFVNQELPGCSVVSYGSSVTMIGLKGGDVNVDVQYNGDMRTPAVLLELLRILKESDKFTEVQEDFDAKVPRIEITDAKSGVRCMLSIGNTKALHTTRLLRMYGRIEPAVIKLSMLYRLWGHFCQVDRQQEGSLPPHSFTLMTIFYLQQKYRLPVLHMVMASHDIENLLLDSGDEHDVLRLVDGEWWYYPTAPPVDEKDETKPDDVDEEVDETAEFSDSDDDLEITFSESPTKESSMPLSKDVTKDKDKPLVPVKLGKCFDGKETPNLAELWLGLLKFYAAQFDMENLIITIRASERVTRSDRGWSHRRIAVEDPCSPKWNLCKPMNSQALFNYYLTRLKHSVFYFHTTHNSVKNKAQKSQTKNNRKSPKTVKNNKNDTEPITFDEFVEKILISAFDDFKGRNSQSDNGNRSGVSKPVDHDEVKGNQSQSKSEDTISPDSTVTTTADDVTDPLSSLVESVVDDIIQNVESLELEVPKEQKQQQQEQFEDDSLNYDACYKFTKSYLMDGKVPIVVCSICKKEGHRKKNCPDEVKIKVHPLPPLTDRLRRMLDRVCRDMFEIYVPKEDEVRMREKVCSDLLEFLQKNYDEDVRICLFGSSRNRFTFRGSDLDVCMTLDGNPTGEDLDYTEVIEGLAKVLRKDPNLRQIIPITTAKVPIVKFYHPKAGLEGDISLYNLLAQRNTSMVALYASIDDRCRMLGYAMKAFVKRCYIGDASRGSLSSYAYILLVIYFLQQRDPPVLPVLQELYTGDKTPEHIVDGWNSWFYDGIGSLDKVWPDFSKNRESLGELWLGMLRFYTEKFDFSHHVVSIRQKKLLTAFEKEWTSKCICIEDPFDLNHNLGAGVSRKMTNFILKVFVKARERFGTDPPFELNGILNFQGAASEYFFNAEFLMDGQEVPNDRCCRICGKIGHFVKDCPKRRQRSKRTGDDQKFRDVECFGCGKKGHFKKDCPGPRGSPVKDAPFLQGHPLHQIRLMMPHQQMMMRPLMQNLPRQPIIVQAKRQELVHTKFQDPQPHQRHQSQTPQKPQENPSKRQQNQTPKDRNQLQARQDPRSHGKTPQSTNKRQQNHQGGSSPHSNPSMKSPFPSSGPNLNPQTNGRAGSAPRQSVNRNLSNDFEPETTRQKAAEKPVMPRPSHSDPARHQTSSNARSGTKNQSHGESPSPGTVYTVKEIETQMLEKAKGKAKKQEQRPKMGENLNHLIPRQTSNEEMHPIPSPGHAGFHGYPQSPPYHPQFGRSPLSPSTPPMYSPQYMAQYSTSPQNRGNPFQFHPPQEYQRNRSNEGLSRTPPSPMGYNYQGISPPRPGYGFPQPQQLHNQGHRGQGSNFMTSDPHNESIAGRTFVNSNQSPRDVRFMAPNSAPPYHSYPPDRQHPGHGPHHGQPQHWSAPNQRK